MIRPRGGEQNGGRGARGCLRELKADAGAGVDGGSVELVRARRRRAGARQALAPLGQE